ncbi:MAG: VIT family protein [Propionibacteriaceae bacterium]|jgi:VIT1/CCC1 family predicted Fe2+/Mn2+ transporter|nr:VIT family protein [Propionibacteriaceae bacterium]
MGTQAAEDEAQALSERLNWLRAGVLGANDGIVSTAGLVFGVAGATSDSMSLLIAGLAGMVAGALSMAGGEYVSVSSQRDIEQAAAKQHARELAEDPAAFRRDVVDGFVAAGLSPTLAEQAVAEMDEDELHKQALQNIGLDAATVVSPWVAARASMLAFVAGAVIPLAGLVLSPAGIRLFATSAAVLLALVLTGFISARLSGVSAARPILRNAIVGSAAMGLTYLVGAGIGTVL